MTTPTPEIDPNGVPDAENVYTVLEDMTRRVQRGDREALVRYSREIAEEFTRVHHMPPPGHVMDLSPGAPEPPRRGPLAFGAMVTASLIALVGGILIGVGGWERLGPFGLGLGLMLVALILGLIGALSDR